MSSELDDEINKLRQTVKESPRGDGTYNRDRLIEALDKKIEVLKKARLEDYDE